jgi:regulator of protease activity HflC (stomatin/prohibitin superfamily)
MSYDSPYNRRRKLLVKTVAIGAVVLLAMTGVLIWVFNSYGRVEPGFVGLVRNGGPFDNRDVIRVITPADGRVNIGFASTISEYPTTDRYDNMIPGVYGADPAQGDDLNNDAYRTRTKDGYDIGVKGQWRYTLNTADPQVLEAFDATYGTRSYAVPGTDERVRVSDGDQGMAVFIGGQLRPVQEEAVRQALGSTTGAQLDPSLGLLTQTSADPAEIAKANANLANATDSSGTFTTISDNVSKVAQLRINQQLGAKVTSDADANDPSKAYILNVRYTLQGISLSPDTAEKVQGVRDSIANLAKANADAAANVAAATGAAQKAKADAQGRKDAAALDADAQVEKQRGYNSCPTCAEIDKTNAQGQAQKEANSGWGDHAPQVWAPGFNGMQLPQAR